MAKNLILDLDNTLYGYDFPHKKALAVVLEFYASQFSVSIEHAKLSYTEARQQTHLELPSQAASHNRILYFQKMLELDGLKSIYHSLELYELYWSTFLEHIALFDGVHDYLESYRSAGGKICILTDLTAHIQHRKLKKLDLLNHIDFLVTSEEAGIEKPHPYMFVKALQKLGCAANEALMIGDSWDKDIMGARAMGISSIWINHKGTNQKLKEGIKEVSKFEEIKAYGK